MMQRRAPPPPPLGSQLAPAPEGEGPPVGPIDTLIGGAFGGDRGSGFGPMTLSSYSAVGLLVPTVSPTPDPNHPQVAESAPAGPLASGGASTTSPPPAGEGQSAGVLTADMLTSRPGSSQPPPPVGPTGQPGSNKEPANLNASEFPPSDADQGTGNLLTSVSVSGPPPPDIIPPPAPVMSSPPPPSSPAPVGTSSGDASAPPSPEPSRPASADPLAGSGTPSKQDNSGVSAATNVGQGGASLPTYASGTQGSANAAGQGGNATGQGTQRRLAEMIQQRAGLIRAGNGSERQTLGTHSSQVYRAASANATTESMNPLASSTTAGKGQGAGTREAVSSTERAYAVLLAALQGGQGPRRGLQQQPDVRTRTGRAPPPPASLCSFGDPYRKPGSGGCCQACRLANARYNYYRESDLDPSAPFPLNTKSCIPFFRALVYYLHGRCFPAP
jgi:hypothetical protein